MTFRRKLLIAAGFEVAIVILVFVVYALGEDVAPLRARRTLTFFMMFQALLATFAPLFAIDTIAARSWRAGLAAAGEALGWLLAACFSAPLLLVLFLDRGAFLLWLLAMIVIAGAGLASIGLSVALARLSRKPMFAVCLAAALILLFELQPVYTLKLIRASRGKPAPQRLLIATGVRTSWMGVAHAMKNDLWQYDLSSPTLYPPNWIGSDYPVNRPGPFRHFLEYLILGAFLAGLGALRGKAREEAVDAHHEEHEEDPSPPGTKNDNESSSSS